MKLIRNTTPDGRCKYALVRLDKIRAMDMSANFLNRVEDALSVLYNTGFLEYAGKNDPEEAFVIKLKDAHAPAALLAYAQSAHRPGEHRDDELAADVLDLVERAQQHPGRHRPD